MTTQLTFRFLLFSLLLLLQVSKLPAQAVSFYEEYHGHISFDWFGRSNNTEDNSASGFSCSGDNQSSSTTMINIPSGATVKKAILYWSGSGAGDFDIKFSGPGFTDMPISAGKQMTATFLLKKFFAASYDITSTIANHGSGDYTVSDLQADQSFSHCVFNTVYSGWSILIVYENPTLPFSTVKIYDGFEAMRDNSKNISIDNILIESPSNTKLGLLAWESDNAFSPEESISVNGTKISDASNPWNKIFNQTNTNSSLPNYNMDLDIFDISNEVNLGDIQIPLKITVGGDLIFLNAIAIAYQNQLPDARVHLDTAYSPCDNPLITLTFTVINDNCNDFLPQGTPISFYKNNTLGPAIADAYTLSDIPIGGAESQTIQFPNPGGVVDVVAVVDPSMTVIELDETNNTDTIALTTIQIPIFTSLADTICFGDSILWDGQYYNTNVLLLDTTMAYNGCDSITDWSLTIMDKIENMTEVTICPTAIPYLLPDGAFANTSGTYTSVLTAANGCDSTIIVDLTVRPNDTTSVTTTICPNDLPYSLPNGTLADTAGLYVATLANQFGCDSILFIDLVVPNTEWLINREICPGDSVLIDGQYFSHDTMFTSIHPSTTGGCDSMILTQIVTKPWVIDSSFAILCEGASDTLPDGVIVSQEGVYETMLDCNHLIVTTLSKDLTSNSLNLVDSVSVFLGESILLEPQPNFSATDYQWSPPTYLDCTDCLATKATPTQSIRYELVTTNTNGCQIKDDVFVRVLLPNNEVFIPNSFSPNNDGYNDFFTIYGSLIKKIKRFEIYSRWGELLYKENNVTQTKGWDGRYKNKEMDTDVYIYLIEIEFTDGTTQLKSGDLTIWR